MKSKLSFLIGLIGMIVAVSATFLEGGSLFQRIFFVWGASFLGTSAFLTKQKMFMALQIVVLIGSILGFFDMISGISKYILMIIPAALTIIYLLKQKYFKNDLAGILGSFGLILLALGFATNAVTEPVLFNIFLLSGGFFIAIYSFISFFKGVRIAMLWAILNVFFMINPAITLIKMMN